MKFISSVSSPYYLFSDILPTHENASMHAYIKSSIVSSRYLNRKVFFHSCPGVALLLYLIIIELFLSLAFKKSILDKKARSAKG